MSQLIYKTRQFEPEILDNKVPIQEKTKISTIGISWQDLMGLSWVFEEEYNLFGKHC